MKLFVIAPVNDWVTERIISVWAKEIVNLAKNLNINVVEKIGLDITRDVLEKELSKDLGSPGLFCFLDHGLPHLLLDSKKQPLLDSQNIYLLKNKFIYTVCCLAGRNLGPESIKQGAIGFLGFTQKVSIPIRGKYPQLFGQCLLKGLVSLLKQGCPAETAYSNMKNRFNVAKDEIASKKISKVDKLFLYNRLNYNESSLVLLGSPNWAWQKPIS